MNFLSADGRRDPYPFYEQMRSGSPVTRQLLEQTSARGELDMAADFAVPLPMMVIAQMLGLPAEDWLQFKQWSDVILKLSYVVSGGQEAAKAVAEVSAVSAEMKVYLRERIAQGPSELLAGLVDAEVDGERLSEDEIRGFFQLLLIAGTETTTNLINNAILCFVE